ncbi:MAG: hypothetical protein ACLGSD_00070 [Acidobacteriota bacterium]
MTSIESLLTGLIDYAGLYPPAGLDMRTAVRNYLDYRGSAHAQVLGRFIVDVSRFDDLREAAGEHLAAIPLSVIAPAGDFSAIERAREDGFNIECIETKSADTLSIARTQSALPPQVDCYCEIPFSPVTSAMLDALKTAGLRAKLRMGGVTPEAFPAAEPVVAILQELIARGIAFKATAGLHHPVRSQHKLTYAPDSACDLMHGFLNLLACVAILNRGGAAEDASRALREQDPQAFRISAEEFGWRDFDWSAGELNSMRRECFVSFGSCSFAEPIADLEAMGWL